MSFEYALSVGTCCEFGGLDGECMHIGVTLRRLTDAHLGQLRKLCLVDTCCDAGCRDVLHMRPFSSLDELVLDIPLSNNIRRKLMQLLPAFPVLTNCRIVSRTQNEDSLTLPTSRRRLGISLGKFLWMRKCFKGESPGYDEFVGPREDGLAGCCRGPEIFSFVRSSSSTVPHGSAVASFDGSYSTFRHDIGGARSSEGWEGRHEEDIYSDPSWVNEKITFWGGYGSGAREESRGGPVGMLLYVAHWADPGFIRIRALCVAS
ncbi:hypothetical protein IW261DRAFT_1428754 [Armillaria novae-zelandiae]|uniref:Uncharacterized protein n=1 Tax=Armillaria novae-zelandiae TaxID=153914 RepID=A0AA39T301_9AGAR|nr:hypothetical protein IW261DRAFT_1428754 [Armillaria novae-zelandiae]